MVEQVAFKNQAKLKLFDEWMKDDHILVHLDARREGVVVPLNIANNPALALKLSYQFQGETSRDDQAITTYLRFDGSYFKCVLPWEAIWGITSHTQELKIWSEDVPKEVLMQLVKEKVKSFGRKLFSKPQEPTDPNDPSKPPKKRNPTLTRVK